LFPVSAQPANPWEHRVWQVFAPFNANSFHQRRLLTLAAALRASRIS